MEFAYAEVEGEQGTHLRPCVPVTFSFGGRSFPVGRALVDTGSDITILPLEVAHLLETRSRLRSRLGPVADLRAKQPG